ncbi:MAG: terminase large subunit [Lachnospiraceae bacterium]|nr:terminase large subunit [Lachnospiraceae bacterium]
MRELLWSLGIKNAMTVSPSARFGIPTGETLYTIRFTTFEDQPTSKLNRKIRRKRERVGDTRSCFHYLEDIEPLAEKVKMQCIQVDSPSHQYLAGISMVPTHNSELAAAVALYMLYADREPSAEVYGAAADRQQASIVFDVARQMVEMTPALLKRSKILAAQKRIVNYENAGFYQVLSAEVGTKHGLNISCVVIDEIHNQPNRKLYDVLTKGSSDARANPLHFIITTAGTDRNSIAYELHTKAADILAGKRVDPTFYPVVYSLGDDEDWEDEKNWYRCNPSLGQTIKIDRLRDAFREAKQNPADEVTFRWLRLNQWVSSTTAWIPDQVFMQGNDHIDMKALEGRDCYGGLDLSSSEDITAFVLCFPPRNADEKYILLPFMWVPEETIPRRVRRTSVPYDVWVQQGYIMATKGNVIDYGFIEAFIDELGKKYHIREIAFDRWGAVEMVQHLEGEGFTVIPFGQGFKDMSPASKAFYELMLKGRIVHGGHPVLRWMAGNVVIDTDPAGNIKPTKKASPEKIDGIVAAIMALDRCIRHEEQGSVYDERDLFVI